MRIFLSCQQALKPHPVPSYAFWEYYLKNALSEAGHEIIQTPDVDWAEGLLPLSPEGRAAWLENIWTRTSDFIQKEHQRRPIGLFIGYLFPNQIEPLALRAIRACGVPTVNFFCDNVREFSEVPAAFRGFDLHWVPEAGAREMYSSAGLPFVYLPMPMWVEPKFRSPLDNESKGVVFIGSHDELREDLIGRAVHMGLNLDVYGAGWVGDAHSGIASRIPFAKRVANQIAFLRNEGLRGAAMRATYQFREKTDRSWVEQHAHPRLAGDAYFETTRSAEVVLGINRCPSFRHPFSDPLRYSRLRDIEAPMLGACYLTEAAPGIGDLYEIGEEIEIYSDPGELMEKARHLQADPARRLRIRTRGQRRALSDHTVKRSLEVIAQRLGIPT